MSVKCLSSCLRKDRGVGEALAEVRRGELREPVDVADVAGGSLRRLEGEVDELGVAEEEREKSQLVGMKGSSWETSVEVRVGLQGAHAVEAVEREHPRDGGLERGAGVVIGCGGEGERRCVAGDSGEDAGAERRQLEECKREVRQANWTNAGVDLVLEERPSPARRWGLRGT